MKVRMTLTQSPSSYNFFLRVTLRIVKYFLYCSVPSRSTVLSRDVKWKQNGVIVAGGNGNGDELHRLYVPSSICVDDNQNVYVADSVNNRIIEWKPTAKEGRIVAGSAVGSAENQLSGPQDVIIDKKTNSFIIYDSNNRRVVRWIRRDGAVGETIISNISCKGLTMDEDGSIYVADNEKHEVRRYDIGDTEGTVVAGGNGEGDRLDQLNSPFFVFVDQSYSVYVSDEKNHRVVKWEDGATAGIVAAGGQGQGDSLSQLNYPEGVIVDQQGTVYVTDHLNNRVMRWFKGATEGDIIAGGKGDGEEAYQVSQPNSLAFDSQGNLYVVERGNSRAQRFDIDSTS
jgi:sugar lactone lactonase YvrE